MKTTNYNLSYLVITKNKLPYLKNRLEKLLFEKMDDDEVLIADGQSTDGTIEYLNQLKNKGIISYFVSENDFGIAHAINKLALAASGTLIKFITDDDVFHYQTIQTCKDFMLLHPEIDIIFTNGGIKNQESTKPIRPLIYHTNYEKWQTTRAPFTATDLGVIMRRSSIPLIGLWNTSFPAPDAEFVFRTMTGKANVAWSTGFSFVNVSTRQSVSLSHMKHIKNDMNRLNKYYLNKNPDLFFIEKLKVLRNKWRSGSLIKVKKDQSEENWFEIINIVEKWLNYKYKENKPLFLWNKP